MNQAELNDIVEQVNNCMEDAMENIRDGYFDIAEADMVDINYLLNQIDDKEIRETIIAGLEIDPRDFAQ